MKPSSRRPTNPEKAAAVPPPVAAPSAFVAEALTPEKLAGYHRQPKVINGQPSHQLTRRFYE